MWSISRRRFLQGACAAGVAMPAGGWPSYLRALPSLDGAGWSVFAPSADTSIIYVSNSTGNDRTGVVGDINRPYKTLAAGKARLRNGKPDWVLLKKGDTWTNEAFGYLSVSGRSATEPMLFSSYGQGARPLIKTLPRQSEIGIGSGGGRGRGDFIAVVGLEFYAHTRDPESPTFDFGTLSGAHRGFFFLSYYNWLLIEDCKFSFYDGNAVQTLASPTNTFLMRRNVVTNSYSIVGHSVGIYIEGCGNPRFEQNLWDNNGWNANIPKASPTIFNRNVYIEQSCGPATATEEMSFNSASEGHQFRTGGTITNSLFIGNSNGFDLGHQLDRDGAPAIHAAVAVNDVIMASRDIPHYGPRNQGIVLRQCRSAGVGIHVSNNIIANIGAGGDDGSAGIFINSNFFVQLRCYKQHHIQLVEWQRERGDQ